MYRVFAFLILLALGQVVFGYLLLHLGIIVIAGMSWWVWSMVEKHRHG